EAFTIRKPQAAITIRGESFSVQLKAAGLMMPRSGKMSTKQRRREAASLGWTLIRTKIGKDGIQVRASANRLYCETQKPLPPAPAADRGQELRVSGGIGFRL